MYLICKPRNKIKIELLTEKDMFFIKKKALGIFFNNIKTDLCINSNEEYYDIKTEVRLKLGITNDLGFIQEAFNIGLLVVDNFIIKNLDHIVFGIAYNIYVDNHERLGDSEHLHSLYQKVYETYLCVLDKYKI